MSGNWEEKPPLLYLPLIHMQNEGPGYGMDLAQMVILNPARITDVSTADGTDGS